MVIALGWVNVQGLNVDAYTSECIATNTVKSQKRRNGASIICFWGQKKEEKKFIPCPLRITL